MVLGEVAYGLIGVVGGMTAFVAFLNGVMASGVGRFYAVSAGLEAEDREIGIERCREWFSSMHEQGIATVLISNNEKERVELFAKGLNVTFFYDAHKPSVKFYKKAMDMCGVTADETAVLGDQLLTDSLSGRRIGAKVIIVPPINDKKNWFFRMKRKLEAPTMRRYFKENGIDASVGKEWL